MSTRTNIHFNHGNEICANIYRHSEGHPEDVLKDLLVFFQKLKSEVLDNRMNHAEYLAAKFLVWQADKNALLETLTCSITENGTFIRKFDESTKHYLNFLSVAPCINDHIDIEYIYEIDCSEFDSEQFPIVRWRSCDSQDWEIVHLCDNLED